MSEKAKGADVSREVFAKAMRHLPGLVPPVAPSAIPGAFGVGPAVGGENQQHPGIHYGKQPGPKADSIKRVDGGLIQLDPMMMLEIELVTAELRAADAEEQLLFRQLQDIREKKNTILRKQSMIMSSITNSLGLPPGRTIRLVDKDQRLCKVED